MVNLTGEGNKGDRITDLFGIPIDEITPFAEGQARLLEGRTPRVRVSVIECYRDNLYLSMDRYRQELMALTEQQRSQLLYGEFFNEVESPEGEN